MRFDSMNGVWYRWFAWFPVEIEEPPYTKKWYWLEWLERCVTWSEYGFWVEYRTRKVSP